MQQERYRHLAPMYYRGARAVFLCFSIDDKQSLISLINKFVPDLCKAFKAKGPEDQPVMYLLGLKSDLEHNRQVSAKEARVSVMTRVTSAQRLNFLTGTGTSAKDEVL